MFIYRHELFNLLFEYQDLREIPEQKLTNSDIKNDIAGVLKDWYDIESLNILLLDYTKKTLSYGVNQSSNDINNYKLGTKAHCVGYAAFHNSILNYALRLSRIKDYKVTHVRGKIELLGVNLNKLSASNFFKDHDFVKIENVKNGEYYYCDPSLYEFSKISKIGFNYRKFFNKN